MYLRCLWVKLIAQYLYLRCLGKTRWSIYAPSIYEIYEKLIDQYMYLRWLSKTHWQDNVPYMSMGKLIYQTMYLRCLWVQLINQTMYLRCPWENTFVCLQCVRISLSENQLSKNISPLNTISFPWQKAHSTTLLLATFGRYDVSLTKFRRNNLLILIQLYVWLVIQYLNNQTSYYNWAS